MTRTQRRALHRLQQGVQVYQGRKGNGRGSWERMMLRLCDAGFAERNPGGGYRITEKGDTECAVTSKMTIRVQHASGGVGAAALRPYLVYLYGKLVRNVNGVGRRFKTTESARDAALEEMERRVAMFKRNG